MIPNRRLAELATGHLWRSPDPAPSQAQHGGSGLCPVKNWQQGPSRGHVPLGQEGEIVTGGPYPKAKSSQCKSRADTPGGSSVMGTCLSLPCSPSAQGPRHRALRVPKATCVVGAAAQLPTRANLPAGPCMAAANRPLHPLGANTSW